MKRVAIVNGPNLNLLGKREQSIYGSQSFEDYLKELNDMFNDSCQIEYFQSNVEGELVDAIHQFGFDYDIILLNAGAYTHTSIAIGDAVAGVEVPVIEVHISNIAARESFRHDSHISAQAKGVLFGFGLKGYELAIRSIL